MPTYDFKCNPCEKTVEVRMSFDEKEIPKCETCREPMNRVYSVPGAVIFKGDGWAGYELRNGWNGKVNTRYE